MKFEGKWADRVRFFLLGVLVMIGFVLFAGATDVGPPNYGRYQVSAWAGHFGKDTGGLGAFVIDTVTGEVRNVYTRIYGPESGVVKVDQLEKPFFSIHEK